MGQMGQQFGIELATQPSVNSWKMF